jgi:type II secretion system protein L
MPVTDRLFVRILTRGVPSAETEGELAQGPYVQWALFRNDELLSEPNACYLNQIVSQLPDTVAATALSNPLFKVIVIVPAESVSLSEVTLPSSQSKHIAKALPFMLEDELTEEVENVHFALTPKNKSKTINVAVIRRTLLQYWIDCLMDVGLQPHVLTPDVLMVPRAENAWALLFDGDRMLLRHDNALGLAFAANQTTTLLGVTLEDAMKKAGFSEKETKIQLLFDPHDEAAVVALTVLTLN